MYRLDEIIGYEQIISHFQNARKMKKNSHAYIIEGETGMGKLRLARTFAKLMQCEEQGIEVCDACQSCKLLDAGNHPDIIEVAQTKKTGLGVDDIRDQINKDMAVKPYRYPYKIYIVDNADQMTVQAQNALLKTIEEPPPYGMIILLASNSYQFLPTILSRCVVMKLNPLPESRIEEYLVEEKHIPDYQAALYAAFAQGNLGMAMKLSESTDFSVMRENMIKVMEVFTAGDKIDILDTVEIFEAYQDSKEMFFELLLTWLRDVLVLKKLGGPARLIHRDKRNLLLKQASILSYNRVGTLIDGLEKVKLQARRHVNYPLSVEMMLVNAINSDDD